MPAAETVPRNEFSDVYTEVGPDNVGGMGDEPSCTITLFTLNEAAKRVTDATDVSSTRACADTSGTAEEDALSETTSTAHQSNDARQSPHDTAAGDPVASCKSEDQQSMYVVMDQVECDPHKVVALRPGQHNQMLLGVSNDVDCAMVAFGCSSELLLEPQHLHSIPALAYVAAGEATSIDSG